MIASRECQLNPPHLKIVPRKEPSTNFGSARVGPILAYGSLLPLFPSKLACNLNSDAQAQDYNPMFSLNPPGDVAQVQSSNVVIREQARLGKAQASLRTPNLERLEIQNSSIHSCERIDAIAFRVEPRFDVMLVTEYLETTNQSRFN